MVSKRTQAYTFPKVRKALLLARPLITKKFEEVQQFGADSAGRLSQFQLLSLDCPKQNQSTSP